MSLVAVIVIVVVVVAAIALLFAFLPRLRERSRIRARERKLGSRRETVISEHREAAEGRMRRAEEAQQRARIAELEAQRERTEADLNHEKARKHEAGLADHELIDQEERDRFAGTSAVNGPAEETAEEPERVEGPPAGRR